MEHRNKRAGEQVRGISLIVCRGGSHFRRGKHDKNIAGGKKRIKCLENFSVVVIHMSQGTKTGQIN